MVRGRTPFKEIVGDSKTCSKCKELKHKDEYPIAKGKPLDRASQCKLCQKEYYQKNKEKWFKPGDQEKRNARAQKIRAAWTDEQREEYNAKKREYERGLYARNTRMKRKYNITVKQYDQILLEQGGVCKGCKKPPTEQRHFDIDHDHSCCPERATSCGNCIRGIFCNRCNIAMGSVQDNIQTLKALIQSIEQGPITVPPAN